MPKLRSSEKRLLKEAELRGFITPEERTSLLKGGMVEREHRMPPTKEQMAEYEKNPGAEAPVGEMKTLHFTNMQVIEQVRSIIRAEEAQKKRDSAPVKNIEWRNFLQNYHNLQQSHLSITYTLQAILKILEEKFEWFSEDIIEDKIKEIQKELEEKRAQEEAGTEAAERTEPAESAGE